MRGDPVSTHMMHESYTRVDWNYYYHSSKTDVKRRNKQAYGRVEVW